MRFLLPLLLCLAACAKPRPLPPQPAPSELLGAKYTNYASWAPQNAHEADCDGLEFRSLLEAGRHGTFNVEAWRTPDGVWQRNPSWSCSRATSQDMIRGLMWYLWSAKRLDLAESTWQYAMANHLVMDPRDPSISTLLPDTVATLALMITKLGGPDRLAGHVTPPCVGWLSGYQAHLQALTLGLRVAMGVGDDGSYACIVQMTERQPHNAFYWAIRGRYEGTQDVATGLLLNEAWWPTTGLPHSEDRCDPWITQRDEGADWLPCAEGKTHSGGDFLDAAALVLGVL